MLGPDPAAQGGMASVIAVYQQAGFIDGIETKFVPTYRSGAWPVRLWAGLSALGTVIHRLVAGRVKLLHIHVAHRTSFYRKSVFVLLGALFNVPVVLHLHSGEFDSFYREYCGPVRRTLVRSVLSRADMLVALSMTMAQCLKQIVPGRRIAVIHNPFVQSRPSQLLPSSGRGNVVLYMGRLTAKKGIFDFLEALRRLRGQGTSFRAVICGTGETQGVQQFVDAHDMGPLVELKGWVSGAEKQGLLESAAIFVLPSYFEGQPMAVLEAMAAGAAVICSRVGGVPDVITDGQDGLLIEAGDVQGLADALRRALEDGKLRDELARAAMVKLQREFSLEKSLASLRELYRNVLSAGE